MYLEQLTKLIRDGASCNLYGCVLSLQITGNEFKIVHKSGIVGSIQEKHDLEFDMTKLGWEMIIVEQAIVAVRGGHDERSC